VIDGKYCKGASCGKCAEACKYDAIYLDMKPETMTVNVGSVVLATGWDLYDVSKLDNLGAGQIKNVISNMQMKGLHLRTVRQAGRSSDPRTTNPQKTSLLSSVQAHAMRIICPIALISAAWRP